MNIYLQLTQRFNSGGLRAIISSGQAVVLHRLAMMSKDGDWIVKEDPEALNHILSVLSEHGARYRFGAPFVGLRPLVDLKKTNREKDYAVIGELARSMSDPRSQALASRSARDLINLAEAHAGLISGLVPLRPLLSIIPKGREALEVALDAERRDLMHANEERLSRYMRAAEPWADAWPGIQKKIEACSLRDAHEIVVRRAEELLPFEPSGGSADD